VVSLFPPWPIDSVPPDLPNLNLDLFWSDLICSCVGDGLSNRILYSHASFFDALASPSAALPPFSSPMSIRTGPMIALHRHLEVSFSFPFFQARGSILKLPIFFGSRDNTSLEARWLEGDLPLGMFPRLCGSTSSEGPCAHVYFFSFPCLGMSGYSPSPEFGPPYKRNLAATPPATFRLRTPYG